MRATTRSALILALASLPSALASQGVTIRSVNDIRFHGALGTLAGVAARFGGAEMREVPTTTYVSGHKLRTENEYTAVIIDADAGRLISVDHKRKTYSSATFDEMSEAMRRAQQSAKQSTANANASRDSKAAKPSDAPRGEMNFKYAAEIDRPGQREKIAGYDAERVFVTIKVEAEATPEGGTTEQVGTLVILLDQWMSKDAPQSDAMAEFQRAYAQKAGQAFKSQAQGLQAAFASDARIKGGFDAAAKEMAKIQGTPLRSLIYVSVVPPGMAFDRRLALNEAAASDEKAKTEDKSKGGGGFKGLVGKLKAAAEEANKQSDDKASAPPKQSMLMTLKDEVRSIEAGSIAADLFAPPAGYREMKIQQPPAP